MIISLGLNPKNTSFREILFKNGITILATKAKANPDQDNYTAALTPPHIVSPRYLSLSLFFSFKIFIKMLVKSCLLPISDVPVLYWAKSHFLPAVSLEELHLFHFYH